MMRKKFGLREVYHGYPLMKVIIKEIGYRLSMVTFVFEQGVVYCQEWSNIWGRLLIDWCFFKFLIKQK